jgi:hypothetical protein
MKKPLFFCLFLCLAGFLHAETGGRFIEFGFDLDAGLANNYINFRELFSNETLVINLNALPLKGLSAAALGKEETVFNVNFKRFSIGLFAGMDGFFAGGLSGELLKLLSEGNTDNRSISGEVDLGGSLFLDTGLRGAMEFKDWKFGVRTSLYIPVFYMPKPLIRLNLDTTESFVVDMSVRMNIYAPFSLEDMEINGSIFRAAGFDMSFFTEYALLPMLDLGGSISHLPVVPSHLTYGMHTVSEFAFPDSSGGIDESFIDALVNNRLSDLNAQTFYLEGDYLSVFRPLRFDFFGRYKPFRNDIFSLKPNIGLSFLTIYGYDKVCFNADLAGRFAVKFFALELSTGYRERMWMHKLGMTLNFRPFELDLGIGLMSRNFADSFRFKGLNLALGMRFGY